MAGFSNDVNNKEIVFADNVDFSGATNPVGQFTANGQLMIGSVVAPNIRIGTLGSSDGSITWTVGSGTITGQVSGGTTAIKTITGNTGPAEAPSSGNFNFLTANTTVKFAGTAATETLDFGITNLMLGDSGVAITSAVNNASVGYFALHALSSGQNNTALGNSSLAALSTGSHNTCLGYNSGVVLATGSDNVIIGYTSGSTYSTSQSSNILISNIGNAGDNNTIRIGTQGSGAGQQNVCLIAGIVGVTAANPVLTTINSSTGQLGVQALTQNAVMIGGASNAVAFTAVGSTGQVLQGNTAAAPTYSTATYPSTATSTGTILRADGTNWVATTATYPATTTINQVLYSSSNNVIGGITAANNGTMISGTTGIPSWLANGTTGQILTATTGSPPSWSAPATSGTVTSVSGTANQVSVATGTTTPVISLIGPYTPATYTAHGVLIGEGTSSIVALAAGSAGQVLQSGGASADPAYSTATYPVIATSTGTILRADGTNWVATTSTYPNTNAVSTILYASSANVMSALATANSGVLATGATGVPSIDTTNFAVLSTGLQLKGNNTNTAPPAGFIGEYISSAATTVALTTATAKTITSISLTAGIWDISANFAANASLANTITDCSCSISTVNNTAAGNLGDLLSRFLGITITVCSLSVPQVRATLSGTTTYYLVGAATFATGTMNGQGRISATRVG